MTGNLPMRLGTAACLAVSGYVHAELYVHGYRVIPFVGPAFLVQAGGSFAIAVLLALGGPVLLRLAAAGLALGALGGFAVSRTVGLFGFTEHGLQPAPEALVSLLAEAAVLVLLGVSHLLARRRRETPGAVA
ncbi:hypothetical protein [Amycolatopsis samaneae]|uniref:DUF4345 domain-containing protein n=1 Tax=Amycolatopsis samaneae TaxID=664691 RepID=A0ABW5GUD6_9PSEU